MTTISKHSFLPPSSADKWMTCYGWLKATEGLTSPTSIYAEEGTAAHELLEMTLRLGLHPSDMTGNVDLALNIATVTDWLQKYLKKHKPSNFSMECNSPWGRTIGHPELKGTVDLAVFSDKELIVGDYKHGAGIVVEVADNRQLMLYLLGLVHKFGRRPKYRIIIFQPRARHEDGAIREQILDDFDLQNFKLGVSYAVEQNIKGGRRVAGDHCSNFCLAAGNCKAYTLYSLEAAGQEFS